jgi:hypothetical protein
MVKISPQSNPSVTMALTERERMSVNGDQADYESVIVNAENRMVPVKKSSRDFTQPLQSVALVSEVMQGQQVTVSRGSFNIYKLATLLTLFFF